MLEGLRCYRNAIEMLLNNIKAYFALVFMNLCFFALLLLIPSGLFVALQDPVMVNEAPIVAAISAVLIFLVCNFLMLTIANNTVNFAEQDCSFKFRDLFKTGISKWKICMMSIGFNFIVFTVYFFIAALMKTFTDNQTLIASFSFVILVEIFISVYFFIFVSETNNLGDFRKGASLAWTEFKKYPKLTYGFLPGAIIFGLVMAYLVYAFLDGMWGIITVMQRPEIAVDMQSCVLHVLLSSFMLVLLNTINLSAKGMFIKAIHQKDKEVKRFVD